LNPNRRVNFQEKNRIKARYRADCYYLAYSYPKPIFEDGDIALDITFNPYSERTFDLDNLFASMKSGLDGICDWWKVNDQRFNPITIRRGVIVPRGSVEISLP
jgi:hypothetical protein